MSTLPHILFIASWYPNEDNSTHGIFIKRHAECVAKNHKVTTVFAKSSGLVEEISVSISEIGNLTEIIILYPKISNQIPLLKEYLKFRDYNTAIKKAVQLAQQEQVIDIVHLQVIFPACIPTLAILKKLKKPLVITEHWTGYAPEDGSYKGRLKTYYTKKIISKANTVVVISNYLKKIMQQCGLKANYQTISNIVDTIVFQPNENKKNDYVNFIHISSLDDLQKNVSGIIRAFAKAYAVNNKLRLTIVGEGEQKLKLIELTKQLAVDKVVDFSGRLTEIELAEIINQHDALVMFSNYETFCLAIAETLACGKPVITTLVGGIEEYMNEQLGLIIEPKNEVQLTQAFLTFTKDKEKYNSSLIREFALTQFNKQLINKQFTALYNQVLKNKH